MTLANYQAAINRPRRVKPGQTWHARLPGSHILACVVIDEVTPNTVVVRLEAELAAAVNSIDWPLKNVWPGVSVEDNRAAKARIPQLLTVPAPVRFVSAEPLLEEVDLSPWLGLSRVSWVVSGAESGRGARPFSLNWARSLRDQCTAAGTAFFFKQDAIAGKKVPTPELDGKRWIEVPHATR